MSRQRGCSRFSSSVLRKSERLLVAPSRTHDVQYAEKTRLVSSRFTRLVRRGSDVGAIKRPAGSRRRDDHVFDGVAIKGSE
ncbi:MAG TPA: hypothetical protein VHR17_05950 [Thermoanaerobaculia bacterium]|nr:hypothetical protein [Thermoanaerobaculia bacterium]